MSSELKPLMVITLSLMVWPLIISIRLLLTPNSRLRKAISSWLALPLTGGADTLTCHTPSVTPTTSFPAALGWTRTEILDRLLLFFPESSNFLTLPPKQEITNSVFALSKAHSYCPDLSYCQDVPRFVTNCQPTKLIGLAIHILRPGKAGRWQPLRIRLQLALTRR